MIDNADMGQGGPLSTEQELSDRVGVGGRAVRRTLEALEAEGLI